MSSPFPVNAILIFQVSSGELTIDPETGNMVEITSPLTVSASLVSVKTPPNMVPFPGIDASAIPMKGNAVEPLLLPETIRQLQRAAATIVDPATGNELKGEFVVTSIIQSRWSTVTQALGTRIQGYFQQVGG